MDFAAVPVPGLDDADLVATVDSHPGFAPLEDAEALPEALVTDKQELNIARQKHVDNVLDFSGVYEVVPLDQTQGQRMVDTRWVDVRQPAGELKSRLVGREYKWYSPDRDDVFAAMSQPHHGMPLACGRPLGVQPRCHRACRSWRAHEPAAACGVCAAQTR